MCYTPRRHNTEKIHPALPIPKKKEGVAVIMNHFFMMPNGVFAQGLRPTCLSVLCYLQRCADRDGDTAFPSLRTIADACGVSRSTVQRALETLAEKGLVEILRRHGDHGRCTSNAYRLLLWREVNRGGTHDDTGAIPTVTPLLTRPTENKTHVNKKSSSPPSEAEEAEEEEDVFDTDTDEGLERLIQQALALLKRSRKGLAFGGRVYSPSLIAQRLSQLNAEVLAWLMEDLRGRRGIRDPRRYVAARLLTAPADRARGPTFRKTPSSNDSFDLEELEQIAYVDLSDYIKNEVT